MTNGIITHRPSHTITALKRWSSEDKHLPDIQDIRAIHVYDFDNTLFRSPLPNRHIWNGPSIGALQTYETFLNGGWWHDNNILASTGEGVEKEEPRAWEGWWNEQIVELVQLSMEQRDALCVLLTGRSESGFAELIKRMIKAKGLEFDMVCLKPKVGPQNQTFASTMKFKQALLEDLVHTYREAEEIRIYEDRPKHVQGFRDFFEAFNRALGSKSPPLNRQPINAEVIEVAEEDKQLDPVLELSEIQSMINNHNTAVRDGKAPPQMVPWRINRTVFFTGYLISPKDTERLLEVAKLPPNNKGRDVRYLANNVLIVPGPARANILDKVGGIGKRLSWRVVGTACFQGKVWAVRVEPVPPYERYHTENPTPLVVLATRGDGKPIDAKYIQNWEPIPFDRQFEFETVVGEKVLCKLEEESVDADGYQFVSNRHHKRNREEDFPPLGQPPQHRSDQRGAWNSPRGPPQAEDRRFRNSNGRGGRDGQRGGGRGGGGRGRGGGGGGRGGLSNGPRNGGKGGRGGFNSYRSLDDVDRDTGGQRGGGYADYDGGYQANGNGSNGGLYNAY